jgi:hypothetical protein
MQLRPRCSTFVAALVVVAAGCVDSSQQLAQQTSNIKPLSILYGRYVGTHMGQPPPSEAEFRTFIQGETALLQQLGVTDPASLFVSTRDNKPYVITYGAAKGPPGPGGMPVIIYEQEGAGGKRYVASSVGAIEEVDDAKFREYVPSS